MQRTTFTVSEINQLIKVTLEGYLPPRITVAGEISSFRPHHSGHLYFTLKDNNSQLPSVIWRSTANKLKFDFANGVSVLATGNIDVYPPFGKYQFIVDTIKASGVGNLQLAFEQMYNRLKEEGLFEEAHKMPLPQYPMSIAVVTSESGAAFHDIADSIARRWPCAALYLLPAPVQGDGAAGKIANAISLANRLADKYGIELLIVGRGGGSPEDLWAFNEEPVVRAIYNSRLPVISAVGHEIDTTLADLAADARSSTPTRAGVIAVPDRHELIEFVKGLRQRLRGAAESRLNLSRSRLQTVMASSFFRNPLYPVNYKTQQLDSITQKLRRLADASFAANKDMLNSYARRLDMVSPAKLIDKNRLTIEHISSTVTRDVKVMLREQTSRLESLEARLQAVDPRNVLKRGYTITTKKADDSIIRSADKIVPEDIIVTEFADGSKLQSRAQKDGE
ncbi:Exodeoxyribonuclease 7 large subunit [Limihaloglobus sulfuriphilus]|uniref:Exodeoxyribonuclease 7 large subunit n=1 Tax=Limihaloglobus sulfuriphilus TaxID=1851148 RepID=A0A1Q2MCZ7_9BACT|nr:exodeoxyribonuclease VII large subunit [Limihaloglobus sulfuriphilus]AQQ70576.1 Exodeoxyribonuclease 7 large subunit [Limihaloglobus sulfuriphilus]